MNGRFSLSSLSLMFCHGLSDSRSHSHFISHRSYTSLPLKLLFALFIFLPVSFCFSIGCVVLAYVGRPKQDRHFTYSITLRRVRATTVQWKSNTHCIFWVRGCGLNYPACNARASYSTVVCGLSGFTALFHIISSTARFSRGRLLSIKCVFWFSLKLLSETFLILRRTDRDMIEYVYWS